MGEAMMAETTASKRFRVTLVRVMSVQVATLLLLWLLQSWFSH
jgi:hypothetical protein